MHCLPVRRNTAVADEVLDGPRSIVQHEARNRLVGTDGGAPSNAAAEYKSVMIMNRSDHALAIRALRSAAPYIRMYKGKTFVVKAGGGVFADRGVDTAAHRAARDPALFRRARRHGARRRPAADAAVRVRLGLATQIVDGRRVTDEKSIEVTAMVLNGLINTRILAICRDLNIDAVGISGVDAGLVRAHRRAPVKLEDGSERTIDYGFVGDIDAVNTAVLLQAARQRPDAGREPAVGRRQGRAAQHQRRYGRRRPRCGGAGGKAHPVHRGARHSGKCGRSRLAHLLHRFARPAAPARRRAPCRTACCRRRRPSKMRCAAVCAACMSSPTRRPREFWARCSPTRARARWSSQDVNALTPAEITASA